MADPVSVTANTLAIINFAAESSKFLFEFFRTVVEASDEINQHVATLRALSSTFAGIQNLRPLLPTEHAWTPDFQDRLADCLDDLCSIECRLKRLHGRLEKGRMQRTWARLKWASDDHYWRRFFTRVQMYHTTFSLDLLTLHIKLGLPRPNESKQQEIYRPGTQDSAQTKIDSEDPIRSNSSQAGSETPKVHIQAIPKTTISKRKSDLAAEASTSSSTVVPSRCEPAITDGKLQECPIYSGNSTIIRYQPSAQPFSKANLDTSPKNLSLARDAALAPMKPGVEEFFSSSSPCWTNHFNKIQAVSSSLVSIRSLYSYHVLLASVAAKLYVSCGPLLLQHWQSRDVNPYYGTTDATQGYGITLVFASTLRKISFTIYFLRNVQALGAPSLSVQWTLVFPSIVRDDSMVMRLASTGDVEGLRNLFQRGKARPSDVAANGRGLLHIAARSGNIELLDFLLQSGADINAADDDGETPLHVNLSTTVSDSPASLFLVSRGADLMTRSVSGGTPLHTLFTPAIADILRYHSESVDEEAEDAQGMTILHYIAWSSKSSVEHVRRYVEDGDGAALVSAKDVRGRTPLHLAAQRGNVEVVRYILELLGSGQVNVKAKDWMGRTCMHYAAESKRSEVLRMVASKGGCVRERDNQGRTVLHYAAARGQLNSVEIVVELGGAEDVLTVDERGMKPASLAKIRTTDATEIVQYLETLKNVVKGKQRSSCGTGRQSATTGEPKTLERQGGNADARASVADLPPAQVICAQGSWKPC